MKANVEDQRFDHQALDSPSPDSRRERQSESGAVRHISKNHRTRADTIARADRALPHVASADVGEAAAQLLANRSWGGKEDVAVVGPEDHSYRSLAAIVSEVLGIEVRYRQIPFDALKTQLTGQGITDAFAQGMTDMFRAKNEGIDNAATAPSRSSDGPPFVAGRRRG